MRIAIPISLLVASFAFSAPVQAGGKGTNRQSREKVAKKACITGDYKKGTDILGDLFVETDDLTYVYNQGRCFEQNHRWEDALDRFREYQRKTPSPSANEKSDIEQHIAECQSHLPGQISAAPPLVVPAAAAPTPVAVPSPAPALQPAAVVMAAAPAPETRQGSGLRIAGIAIAAAGVAAIAGGVVLAMKTGSLTDELNKQYNRDKASTRDSYETWGWVSYGVGAAALVTGTTLHILGWRAGRSAPSTTSVSILPALVPGGASLFLRGAY